MQSHVSFQLSFVGSLILVFQIVVFAVSALKSRRGVLVSIYMTWVWEILMKTTAAFAESCSLCFPPRKLLMTMLCDMLWIHFTCCALSLAMIGTELIFVSPFVVWLAKFWMLKLCYYYNTATSRSSSGYSWISLNFCSVLFIAAVGFLLVSNWLLIFFLCGQYVE